MSTLEALRRQIQTATDLGSVVRTMKTLAAVNIRQYEQAVAALTDYTRTIELGFQIALSGEPQPQGLRPSGRSLGVILFGSDLGLCGQFNEDIVSYFKSNAAAGPSERPTSVLVVGTRAAGPVLDSGWNIERNYASPNSASEISTLIAEMLLHLEQLLNHSKISDLDVYYNHRTSGASYAPQRLRLIPMDPQRFEHWSRSKWDSRSLPMFVTERSVAISELVSQYLFVSLFRACAESLASENASRISAMQAAETNIDDRLETLTGEFNQLRQSAITEELLEVLTGFEALKDE